MILMYLGRKIFYSMLKRFSFLLIISFSSHLLAAQEMPLQYPEEKHLANLEQLTFGGDNAEAYWSFDNKKLVFQSNNPAWD